MQNIFQTEINKLIINNSSGMSQQIIKNPEKQINKTST